MPMVSHLFTQNKVKYTYDFWDDSTYVYHKEAHGQGVSFIVIGNEPSIFL
jgi:hypothetical protein